MRKSRYARQSECDLCGLHESRTQVVLPDGGIRRCGIVVMGEGPGADEDKHGVPFIGRSGKLLRKFLIRYVGSTFGRNGNTIIMNAVACRPPNNRTPWNNERDMCANWVRLHLAMIQPRLILAVGKVPTIVFIKGNPERGYLYSDTDLRRVWRDTNRYNFKVMPVYHPAYILRNNTVEVKAKWAKNLTVFGRAAKREGLI